MSTITTLLLKSNQPAPLSGIVSNSHIQQETRINKWLKETDENTVRGHAVIPGGDHVRVDHVWLSRVVVTCMMVAYHWLVVCLSL